MLLYDLALVDQLALILIILPVPGSTAAYDPHITRFGENFPV